MTLNSLTEEEFRQKRAEIVALKYKLRCDAEPTKSKTKIMESLAADMGIHTKTVRFIIYRSGLPTCLPAYKNAGYKHK